MLDHIAPLLYYAGVHLFFASSVCVLAWALTSAPWGSANVKYWIWVATGINFCIPIGAAIDRIFALHLAWATPLGVIGGAVNQVAENRTAARVVAVVWLTGVLLMFIRLVLWIRRERGEAGEAGTSRIAFFFHGIPVRFDGRDVPTVDGVWRPQIFLPAEIEHLLSSRELDAVLLHELTHARRRDNLLRLIYEVGLCILWFHPLVWMTGARLALYQELSCDESAVRGDRGGHLISALAKFAAAEHRLLRASISSQLSQRLSRLAVAQVAAPGRLSSALLSTAFTTVSLGGLFETVAHTACCFLPK
jgi:beta-lactamase regulating signal transducer with metallopeptidase domain